MPRYSKYQDYVIRDGRLVGEFELLYQDFDDPWEQTTREQWTSEKAIALNLIQKTGVKRVVELGCGFGDFTDKIRMLGVQALGTDISETAVEKAKSRHPLCAFEIADILDFHVYDEFQPDMIVMAEITWYVLEKLQPFVAYLKKNHLPLIHLLNTYPPGSQKYGTDHFTNLDEIMTYFGADYDEWGEVTRRDMVGCKRTYFLGRY